MKCLVILENIRTAEHAAICTFSELAPKTVIGWGADDRQPDGIAQWEVVTCEKSL